MKDKTKKWLAIAGLLAVCAVLVFGISRVLYHEPDREAQTVERESEETELFVETETPEPVQAESAEAETEEPLVIETETGTSVNDREQEIQETPKKTEAEKEEAEQQDTKNGVTRTELVHYYGGEFISLRGDVVARINEAYPALWNYNLERFAANQPKLNEEAHFLSVVATRLNIHNNIANQYVKRLWTYPKYNTVEKGDEQLAVWHLPYEKKRGLYLLYKHFVNHPTFDDEEAFRKKASAYTGVPTVTFGKRIRDFITILSLKIKDKCIY